MEHLYARCVRNAQRESCVNRWKPFCVRGFSFFCRLMWLVHVTVCVCILFTGSAVELWDTVAQKKMVKRDATAHICLHHREEEGGGRVPVGVPAYCKTLKVRRIREVHNLLFFFNCEKELGWLVTRQNKTFNSLERQVPNLAFMKSTGLFPDLQTNI